MKRIFIVFALCLVSFQSYAESEMTFKEFGDVVYSEDQSVHFMRYTDTAVKRQKVMKALRYSAGKYGDANGFRDACLAKCAGEEKCGGVVFQYHITRISWRDNDTPKKCNFKALEPTTRTDTQKKKDFYRRICYGGGPGGYSSPDGSGDNETACVMFGKTLVKTASGTIVAPTTCNDGDPYTKANDQACYAAGKTACWKGPSGELAYEFLNLWTVGATNESAKKHYDFSLCWRVCAGADACYGDKANILKNLPESMGCKRAATIVEGSVNAGPGSAGLGALYRIEGVFIDLWCGG